MSANNLFPKVTVVIPNWNTERWLKECLDSLRVQTFQDFHIILIDNGSTDNSLAFVQTHYPDVEILAFKENRGFAPAVNAGIWHTQSEYVALLNVDTEPYPDWLANLVKVMEQSPLDVGCLASKMLSLQNPTIIDDAGNVLSWYGSASKRGNGEPATAFTNMEEVFSASGGATLYRRSFLEELGGFDESFVTYLEDVDLGLRGRLLGYRCLYVPTAQILHQWGGAEIPRPKYVYLVTRNRLALLLKNIPWSLLIKHSPTLLYGQLYFFLVYKKPLYTIAGILACFIALPHILRQRYIIQHSKKIPAQTLEALLSTELGEPGLWNILRDKLTRR